MVGSTSWDLRTSEDCNKSKAAVTSRDALLNDVVSDQKFKPHFEANTSQHRGSLDLVSIAQAALETEANFRGEGSDITKSIATLTTVSTNPNAFVAHASTPQHAITRSAALQGILGPGPVIQEDQPQDAQVSLEIGTAHDQTEMHSDEEDNKQEKRTSLSSVDFTAPSTRTSEDDVILVEIPVDTVEKTSVQQDSKPASGLLKHTAKLKGEISRSSIFSGIHTPSTRRCGDNSGSNAASAHLGLGSLSRFLETRNIIEPNRSLTSPYIAKNTKEQNLNQLTRPWTPSPQLPHTYDDPEPSFTTKDFAIPDTLECRNEKAENLVLFLSTALLKTHIQFVRLLETRTHSLTIFFRDCNQVARRQPGTFNKDHAGIRSAKKPQQLLGLQHEADVIISPTAGIILTTSHAVTQLYLPGHKPSNPTLTTIKGINSPLRERIFQAVPRYEQIYILICHSGASAGGQHGSNPESKMDKRTMKSTAALTTFCASFSHESTITPLIITSSPQSQVEWVLTLASKHTHQLPETRTQKHDDSISVSTENNTNTIKGQKKHRIYEYETSWELFLRSMGLNPFAARVVLDILSADGSVDEHNTTSVLPGEREPSVLSTFVEMTPQDRQRRFGVWLGFHVLRKLESVIDIHWEC